MTKEISNFTSAIEFDLYFKAQTNDYLSFLLKEFMSQKSFEEAKLLNCICNDAILMSFLTPYFKETATVDLLGETKSWFKNPTSKFSFSRRSLIYLKSFSPGYFDCVAIRLFNRQITFENFKNAMEVFKKIAKSLILIEDHRPDNDGVKHSQYIGECNKIIETNFLPVSKIATYKWSFKQFENSLL